MRGRGGGAQDGWLTIGLPGDDPEAGGGELEEVAVGVAEVVAADGWVAGGGWAPVDGALDGEAAGEEALLPGVDVLGGDGEGEVDVALGVVGEVTAISRSGGGAGGALAEEEEDLAVADLEGGEAVVGLDLGADEGEAEEVAV